VKFEIIISSIVFLSFSACNLPKKYVPNPEEQIVRELSRKRIVMLGDFAHEFPLSLHSLTSTLSTWSAMLEKGESDQRHLTLFLEADHQIVDHLNYYLKTGDLNPLLEFVLPSTSVEPLEFYSDLRRITTRIDSLNGVLPQSNHIVFDVQGPEAVNVFDPKGWKYSEKEAMLFYVRERDSLTAINIFTYLRDHPGQKGLMFFGNGHLIKNIVRKFYSSELTAEESRGAYLGYYLKREFGDTQVFTIGQVARSRSPIKLEGFGETDVIVLSADVPWKDSSPDDESLVPDNFDAFIIRNGFVLQGHPLSRIFSQRIISASIKRLELLEPHLEGWLLKRYHDQAVQSLRFLTDTNLSKSQDWKSWCATHRFDGWERLRSGDLPKRLADDCFQRLGTPEFPVYIDNLINLGFDPRVGSRTMSRQEWDKDFNEMWPQMVLLNAIGIYWIGNSDERGKARAYLVESSGKSFQEPDQYLKWWRKRFFNVTH
jgi:hypothetical protein